ncbi:MAG: hypothetical protein DBY33_00165 [Lachnospiraceae bacterium]|nr:MAG: hypothetical protein DBY33_00165 [Lachnospiraceae bacterium]
MNLKYYLRGLGVGIVVTSLILGIGLGSRKETLSNEEIKERARELGMVEESITVAEAAAQKEEEAQEAEVTVAPVPEENAESDAEPIVSAEPEVSSEPAVSTGVAPGVSSEPEVSSEPAVSTGAAPEASEKPNVSAASEPAASTAAEAGATPEAGVKPVADEAEEDNGTAPEKEIVDITINPGEGSYVISQKLEQSGLIDDAAEYDAYLCDNGYHTKLRAGVHKIPMGSTREEIAKLLCR